MIATDIDADALAALEGGRIQTRRLDVRNADAIAATAAAVGAVDIVFNCAGFVHHGTILECDEAAFDFSMALNVKANYAVTRALLPAMLGAGGGSVIFVASAVSSMIAAPNRFVYGATKAAVIGMMKAVAADFVTQGIRANAICPGTVESPSWHGRVRAQGRTEAEIEVARAAFIARQPMGRIGQPEEIAALAVYLASDESGFVTGQTIGIDGGWSNT